MSRPKCGPPPWAAFIIPMKVLAVEDVTIPAPASAGLSYKVLIPVAGEAAFEVLAADPVRVVATNRLMPGLNELELCRRLKARTPIEETQCAAIAAGVLRAISEGGANVRAEN